MRPWFYLDKLSQQDRAQIRRWHMGVIGGYTAAALLLAGMVAVRTDGVQAQMAKLVTTSAQAAGK